MFLIGFGDILLGVCFLKLTNDWMAPKERVFATSIITIFMYGSKIFGFLLPDLLIDIDEPNMDVVRS